MAVEKLYSIGKERHVLFLLHPTNLQEHELNQMQLVSATCQLSGSIYVHVHVQYARVCGWCALTLTYPVTVKTRRFDMPTNLRQRILVPTADTCQINFRAFPYAQYSTRAGRCWLTWQSMSEGPA